MTKPGATLVKPLLLTAGVASSGMALFHFVLPTVFQWSGPLEALPASIRWGVYSINAFFSTLLLLGGIATIRVARSPRPDRMIVWDMAIFWIVNAGYQLIWPFPLQAVGWGTLAFASLMVAFYLSALRLSRAPEVV